VAATQQAIDLIRGFEGLRLTAYQDGVGWAIGYGHNSASKPDDIDRATAEALLIADANRAAAAVDASITVSLSEGEHSALTSLVFNIGAFAFAHSTLAHSLNMGDRKRAAAEFDSWRYSRGVVSPELVKRRQVERAIFEGFGMSPGPTIEQQKGTNMDIKGTLKEPSTWAGFGIIFQAIATLIASHGVDPTSWATLIAGIAAVVKREQSAA
jgi:lysozyme